MYCISSGLFEWLKLRWFLIHILLTWTVFLKTNRHKTFCIVTLFEKWYKNLHNCYQYIYYTGTRTGQILHTRLRMHIICLNEYLFRRNLLDSSNYLCSLIDSRFLFNCQKYDAPCNEMIFSINHQVIRNTNLLLFVFLALTLNQTKDILPFRDLLIDKVVFRLNIYI